jgi:benzodiazapine receptor
MGIFNDKADVAIFLLLPLMLFTELFSGTLQVAQYRNNKDWYDNIANRIIGMPPSWLFPVAWSIIYILIWIALFLFYRDTDFATGNFPQYAVDTITILVVLNLVVNKMWSFVFFIARRASIALAMTLLLIASNVAIVVIFAVNNRLPEWILWLPYTIWCFYALYLNAMWVYIENSNETARLIRK